MTRLRQIVVDCRHPAALAQFWAALLDDFEIRPYDDDEVRRLASLGLTPETDPCVILDGIGVELCFQLVDPPPAPGKRPAHLDLRTTQRDLDVARAVALGAVVVERFEHHTWLRDPEGGDFCLVDDVGPS